jgi:CubicO group peptidase (beta-lactamase class C family)
LLRPAIAATLVLLVLLRAGAEERKISVSGPADPQLAAFDELMVAFVRQHDVPGAALAVSRDGKLIYARGFGDADRERGLAMQPRSLFRIASISKPITAAAILRLIEQGKLKLDNLVFDLLPFEPPPGRQRDPRLKKVTVRHLLEHTGGWDRAVSFDPMFRPLIIAADLGVPPPAGPEHVIRYMLGQQLDFEPGSRYAYCNFGYCVLGRLIEKLSGKPYATYVQDEVLTPLGIRDMQLGKTLQQASGEVRYVDGKRRTAKAVVGPELGKKVPVPYGAWYLEAMDAHGGWIASAPDLVRFASAFDQPDRCPILQADSVRTMFGRPAGAVGLTDKGEPRDAYYALGWNVRVAAPGKFNASHAGALDGTATLLVRRHDGLCWAVLFNRGATPEGKHLGAAIDKALHEAADKVVRMASGGR